MDKQLDVDAFFCFAYQFIATPLADLDDGIAELLDTHNDSRISEWAQAREGDPLASASAGISGGIDKHYFQNMGWDELYDHFVAWHNGDNPPSMQCMRRGYEKSWSKLLGFRYEGQHERCDKCAELTKAKKEAPAEAERLEAAEKYRLHLNQMWCDRRVDRRLTYLSELSCAQWCTFEGLLHLRIDGMDQAKFRCPRNMASAKKWATLYRPTLHLVGMVMEGLFELYVIMHADIPKDANMECTMICMALDTAFELLAQKGISMIPNVSIKYDNTAREGKNQIVAKFEQWLVAREKCRAVQDGNNEVGHTHDELDRQFAQLAWHLATATVLEDPQEFRQCILDNMKPSRGRKLIVQVCDGIWDWKQFFEPLGYSMSGIAASKYNTEVCHSKRFLRREDLKIMDLPGWEVETPEVFKDVPQSPKDTIMLCKHFWSDDRLSQPPVVVFPHKYLERLPPCPTRSAARNPVKTVKEFLKTATEIEKPPWKMHAAAQYLRMWLYMNETSCHKSDPLPLKWVADAKYPSTIGVVKPPLEDITKYAPQPPAKITVNRAQVKIMATPREAQPGAASSELSELPDGLDAEDVPPPPKGAPAKVTPAGKKRVRPATVKDSAPKKRGRPPKVKAPNPAPGPAPAVVANADPLADRLPAAEPEAEPEEPAAEPEVQFVIAASPPRSPPVKAVPKPAPVVKAVPKPAPVVKAVPKPAPTGKASAPPPAPAPKGKKAAPAPAPAPKGKKAAPAPAPKGKKAAPPPAPPPKVKMAAPPPAPAHAGKKAAPPPLPKSLGCGRCRGSPNGCDSCQNPWFTGHRWTRG